KNGTMSPGRLRNKLVRSWNGRTRRNSLPNKNSSERRKKSNGPRKKNSGRRKKNNGRRRKNNEPIRRKRKRPAFEPCSKNSKRKRTSPKRPRSLTSST